MEIGALAGLLLLGAGWTQAGEYAGGWGPAVGAMAPTIEANDQTGAVRSLDSLAGKRGLLLFMNRPADWWPLCKAQLVQLEQWRARFESEGVNVAAMT
ncbi:MAG: redoxin domain-containing protein [Pseudomonadales bacterium]|jgi:peroxiredoxin|nr:redoxin domain-containing protein [Pseudomonadales bacterium]MDP6470609.1 redoxin domain-containing protein [Pseudomonadales bacterium]MDP6828536.1 redoxin domain-containing protein [Pseudomonadales bacterium]MDP6972022.1 redoxin domain-containing protein [Pseudomonadales bacterium]|tara:strand:- start:1681 stop:1974 length:294 start_codon:yes stop_codon:yes gene_type:complete